MSWVFYFWYGRRHILFDFLGENYMVAKKLLARCADMRLSRCVYRISQDIVRVAYSASFLLLYKRVESD